MKTLGERLKFLRGSSSQAEFALLLGIPQVTLGNYERNRNEPKFDLLRNICFRFEINVEWLLFGTGPMRPGEDSAPAPHTAPERPVDAPENACARYTKLEAELELERQERRELTMENRQMAAENRNLWKENGELREKCARLEERQFQRSIERGDTESVGNAG